MNFKGLAACATILISVASTAHSQSILEQCRAYARAIEAVAEARDNLDDPSWEKLVDRHPTLKKNGKNDRAVLYAQLINLRAINKNATPLALKMNAFESCPTTYMCAHLGEGCPK